MSARPSPNSGTNTNLQIFVKVIMNFVPIDIFQYLYILCLKDYSTLSFVTSLMKLHVKISSEFEFDMIVTITEIAK
jgi:hypothetical protein